LARSLRWTPSVGEEDPELERVLLFLAWEFPKQFLYLGRGNSQNDANSRRNVRIPTEPPQTGQAAKGDCQTLVVVEFGSYLQIL
jgi:hypothetical protein